MKTEFTCPSGHVVKAEEVRSYIDLTKRGIDEAITFDCSGGKRGHSFNLRKAVGAGMFTIEEANSIRLQGERQRAETGKIIKSAVKGRS